jgi:hypothetical protein
MPVGRRRSASGVPFPAAASDLDGQAQSEDREAGQYGREDDRLKRTELRPAMQVSEPACDRGGVYDQQAGRLPPEARPSPPDAS